MSDNSQAALITPTSGAAAESDAARLSAARERIARAAAACGRDPQSVRLVVASKTQPSERIEPLIQEGQLLFGENRVQEAKLKWPALMERHPGLELRLIGPLQSNKAKEAVQLFDVIETLDRPSLAESLAREIQKQGRSPKLYVEVNTGSEAQKSGVPPEDANVFIRRCAVEFGLTISGLMCIPPATGQASPHFALLAKIAAANGLEELSMGMSADYPLAIQLGATHVRLGTAVFGSRTA